jgi:hypothetical protein
MTIAFVVTTIPRAGREVVNLDGRRHRARLEPERPGTVLSDWRQHDGGARHDTAVVLGWPANRTLQERLPGEHVSVDRHHLRVTRDGQRFVMIKDQATSLTQINVVVNWSRT